MRQFFLITLIFGSTLFGEGCGLDVGAGWLYWIGQQDDLEYASHVQISTSGVQATILKPDGEYKSGFKVFADYAFCNSSFGTIFTRILPQGSNSLSLDPAAIDSNFISIPSQNFPILTFLSANNLTFSSISASWRANINYLDLDFGYDLPCGNFFEITPHIGLRGLWMTQHFHIEGTTPDVPGVHPAGTFVANFHEHDQGYGLEGGIHGTLQVGCGFSLVGHLGGALLYTRINDTQTLFVAIGDPLSINDGGGLVYHACPMIDSFIGLQFARTCYAYPVALTLGWEQHIIMNICHYSAFKFGDLTLQGLTLQGSVGF